MADAAECPSKRERAMHSEVVITISTMMVTITVPAACDPINATIRGMPIKPELGNAPTNAPKEASFQPMRSRRVMAITSATITMPHRA